MRQRHRFSDLSTGVQLLFIFIIILLIGFPIFYSVKTNLDLDKLVAQLGSLNTNGTAPVAVITDPDASLPEWYKNNFPNMSSLKGYAPLPVFLEGWSSSPRTDIVEYEWNFNDASAYAGNPNILKTFNGAHVYERPGTYTATLTVTDKNGKKSEPARVTVEVLPRGGKTFYVDSINGNDTNDGLTPTTAWKTADKAFTGLRTSFYTPGDTILFKRGQTFDFVKVWDNQSHAIGGSTNSILFAAYGDGAKPVFQFVGTTSPIGKGGTIFPIKDRVARISFVDLVFKMGSPLKENDADKTPYMASLLVAINGGRDILFLRSEGYDSYNSFIGADYSEGYEAPLGIYVIDSKIANTTYTAPYASTPFYTKANRLAVLNTSFDLSGNHQMYLKYLNKAVIAHNTYTRQAFGRTAIRVDGGEFNKPTNNVHIYGNKIMGWRDNLPNLGDGRAGGSHSGGGRWNYSLVEIAQNVKFNNNPPSKTYLGQTRAGLFGRGALAGQRPSVKVVSLSPATNQGTFALLDSAGQVVETVTASENQNLRRLFTNLETYILVGDIGTESTGKTFANLYQSPALQSMEYVTFERNIVTNGEKMLVLSGGDNMTIKNNIFVSPSITDAGGSGRIEVGHMWEWRPMRNLSIIGNTVATKANANGNTAIIKFNRYKNNWGDFYYDKANPFGNEHQNVVVKNNVLAVDPGTNGGKAFAIVFNSNVLLPVVLTDNNAYYSPLNSSSLFKVYDKVYSFESWKSLTSRDSKSFASNPGLTNLTIDGSASAGGPSYDTLFSQVSSYLANLKPIYTAPSTGTLTAILTSTATTSSANLIGNGWWSPDSFFDFSGNRRLSKAVDIGAFQVTPFDDTAPTTSASPQSGTYSSAQNITLSSSEAGMTFYCLGLGCKPTTVYSSSTPLSITSSSILNYYSVDLTGNEETVKTATYTISNNPNPVPTGPVLDLSMDTTTGGGTTCPQDKCPIAVVGKVNSALNFNGSSSYLEVANSSTLNPSSEISISVWVKPDGWATGNRRVLQKGISDNQYRLTSQNGVLLFQLYGLSNHIVTTSLPSDGSWHHIVGLYNRSNREIALYVDGVKKASKTTSGNINVTSDPLYIGTKKPSSIAKDFFKGDIDEIKIYNRALSEAEIKDLSSK